MTTPTATAAGPPLQQVLRAGRVVLGSVLVALVVLPIYRYADRPDAGPAGSATVELVAINAELMWSGTLVLALLGLLAGILAAPDAWDRALSRLKGWILRPAPWLWAAGLAVVSFALTLWFTVAILEGKPNLIDAMAQLVQARYMAAGAAGGPLPEPGEFWAFQNMIFSEAGWVSHFPPGQSLWLSLFLRAGLLEISGAALMAVTAALTYLSLRRLVPGQEVAARLGGLATAVGTFLLPHAGSYMNHGLAAALASLAVYTSLRGRNGRAVWTLASGAALGAILATRPVFAVVVGLGVVLPVGVSGLRRGIHAGGFALRTALAVLGALPFVAWLLAYNTRFFGHPLTFGYQVTAGPAVGLGFHVDPWGNVFTPAMAVALTSADLTALSLALLEIPLPLVALVGIWLAVKRRLPEGAGILAAWALLPVAAQFFYWHHGQFMGPRLLSEAAPAWAALVALAAVDLVRMTPREPARTGLRFSLRTALSTVLAGGVLAAGYLAPLRLVRLGGEYLPSMRLEPPVAPEPSLVFVHGAWSGRVFARMVAQGWQLHEIETALRQNDLCLVQEGLDRPGSGILESLDLDPRPGTRLVIVEPFPGNRFAVRRESLTPEGRLRMSPRCTTELLSDRYGLVEAAVYYWQGDLPGLGGDGPMYVRDMGPAANREVLERYADRTPYVLTRDEVRGPLVLLPYDDGVARLWAAPTPAASPPPQTAAANGGR